MWITLVALGLAAVPDTVTGVVSYRQRIALPPEAVIEVKLQDTSRADAPAIDLATQTIRAEGKQPPYAFTLRLDPTRIEERNRYTVAARITVGGQLRFISDRSYAVLTHGAPSRVDLVLVPVGGRPPAPVNRRVLVDQIDAAVPHLTPSTLTRLIAGEELAITTWRDPAGRLRIDAANGPISYRCYFANGVFIAYREQSPGSLFTFTMDESGQPVQVVKEVSGKNTKVKPPELEAARARAAELLNAAAP
jgi:putative lipoprotein